MGHAGHNVRLDHEIRQPRDVQVACVRGHDGLAVGQRNSDGIRCGFDIDDRGAGHDEVSSRSCVGDRPSRAANSLSARFNFCI